MFRCAMPVFTCVLEFLIHGTKRPLMVYLSLIPVIVGTMLVCMGDVIDSSLLLFLGSWYYVWYYSSLYQLYNLFFKGYYNQVSSFR